MEIIKNKYHCKCKACLKPIITSHKVISQKKYYHITCFYNHVDNKLKIFKDRMKILKKYKKHMILENL